MFPTLDELSGLEKGLTGGEEVRERDKCVFWGRIRGVAGVVIASKWIVFNISFPTNIFGNRCII